MLNDIITSIKLLSSSEKELYRFYKTIIGSYPRNISYYKEALIHSSAHCTTKDGQLINNERLEFLGDAILDASVADILFKYYPTWAEGDLTKLRSKIVSRENMNLVASRFGISKILNTSNQDFPPSSFVYGNALEAIIGAIYLDRGYHFTKNFIEKHIIGNIEEVAEKNNNFKSQVIEWAQKRHSVINFETNEISKDENKNLIFKTILIIDNETISTGVGGTKKESQQKAAEKAVNKLIEENKF